MKPLDLTKVHNKMEAASVVSHILGQVEKHATEVEQIEEYLWQTLDLLMRKKQKEI